MFIIISNTVQSKIITFIKFIWKDQHQPEYVTTIIRKSTNVYHLHQYKAEIDYLVAPTQKI